MQSDRDFIEVVLWIARTGTPWRDLPSSMGNWNHVYVRFRNWEKRGVWKRLWQSLQEVAFADALHLFIDSTCVCANQHAAGAKRDGADLKEVIEDAQKRAGYAWTERAKVDRDSLLRNLTILERLGCLDEEGMAKLRKGNAPTITKGPYVGDIASVDHIIPRSIVPELDERLYNLEFMPSRMNRKKGNAIGQRQRSLTIKWSQLGLLSADGLNKVMIQ